MKRNPYKTTITFRVDPAVKKIIRKEATKAGLTISRYVELSLSARLSSMALDELKDAVRRA